MSIFEFPIPVLSIFNLISIDRFVSFHGYCINYYLSYICLAIHVTWDVVSMRGLSYRRNKRSLMLRVHTSYLSANTRKCM